MFDWTEQFKTALAGWRERMQRMGVTSSYAMVTASALWPIAAAARGGDWSALVTLGGALGASVGGNLIANQIQQWKDEAECVHQIAALEKDDQSREALDKILEKLGAFAEARLALAKADRMWFSQTLRAELAELGNLGRFAGQILGDGDVVISGTVEQSIIAPSNQGAINTGPGTVIQALHGDVHQHFEHPASTSPDSLTEYLTWLANDCAPLRLKAIDQGAGRPGREPLGLASVYVDLNLDMRKRTSLADELAAGGNRERYSAATASGSYGTCLVPALEAVGYHKKLVLLGAPGSGKSTLSAYLALSLAQAVSGAPNALERLGKWWKAGPLLPVRVVLRQFAAGLPKELAQGRAKHLWDFIDAELTASGLPNDTGKQLRSVSRKTGAMFLFDGLDEAADVAARSRVLEAVDDFSKGLGSRCRLLLTSRPYAWEESSESLRVTSSPVTLFTDFPAYRLANFESDQIRTFIVHWYDAIQIAGWIGPQEAAEKTMNLQVAVRRPDLEVLARNPLLLTLMATLHSNRTRLPEDRADLYNEVVELLLQRWNETIGADRGLLDALAIPSLKLGDLREVIQQLAFATHEKHVGQDGVADLPEGDLLAALRELTKDTGKAALALEYIEKRAGLLLGQGKRGEQRRFTFPHRTFQEYLAACYLAGRNDFCQTAADLARGPNSVHWREVLFLAARHAKAGRGVPAADALVHCQSLADWRRTHGMDSADWVAAVLAGEQLLEIGLAAVDASEEHRTVRDRVADWIVGVLESSSLPPTSRAQAGNVLARLGDPRKRLVPSYPEDLDAMEFCYVAPGPFIMGDGGDRHENTCLRRSYWISRCPVTVAQFSLFLKEAQLTAPKQYGEPFSLSNHPVVGVNWIDCLAFCRWLNAKWKGRLPDGYGLTLPSEAEWEKAARGGLDVPQTAIVRSLGEGLVAPQEEVMVRNPLPDTSGGFGPHIVNAYQTKIGTTSPVGCFAQNASPYGAMELVGNVWEWTRSRYRDYPYDPTDGREDLSSEVKESRALRGGSWFDPGTLTSCACRLSSDANSRENYFGFRLVASSCLLPDVGPLNSERAGGG